MTLLCSFRPGAKSAKRKVEGIIRGEAKDLTQATTGIIGDAGGGEPPKSSYETRTFRSRAQCDETHRQAAF